MKQIIKVKNTGEYKYTPQIIEKGDWIDLRLSETVDLDPGDGIIHLPLGVAMELPPGYELTLFLVAVHLKSLAYLILVLSA